MSTHETRVIRITEILPHPNADRLQMVPVFGYLCAIRKDSFKIGDLAVFVEPDYVVPLDRPEFSFLSKPNHPERKSERIAVQKLRGVYSQGLLVPAPSGCKEGDNAIELLGITRYEPPEEIMVRGAFAEKGPEIVAPKYDLENLKKYNTLLIEDEEVIVTGKIHGCNSRWLWHQDRMWVGSHTQWKRKPGEIIESDGQVVPNNAWWEALKQNPWMLEWCKAHPDIVVYGEVYGQVQKGFQYGMAPGKYGIAVFDILQDRQWIPNAEFVNEFYNDLKFVQTLYRGPFKLSIVEKLTEMKETFNNCGGIREGVVVVPVNERWDPYIGRVKLKYVSNQYLGMPGD